MKEAWAFKKSVRTAAWSACQESKPFWQANNYKYLI